MTINDIDVINRMTLNVEENDGEDDSENGDTDVNYDTAGDDNVEYIHFHSP